MPTLDEATLRQMLREHITEPYRFTEIAEFEDEFDPSGQPIPHRDSYRRRYEGRLARLRAAAPERTDLHDDHAAVIRVLDATAQDERLFHWVAQSATHEYSGVSTRHYIVTFYEHRLPDGQKRDA